MDEISPDDVRSLADDETVYVVDIRSPTAFERGHVPGSRNVPFGELPGRVEELDGADRIVTVCPHGHASVQAARLVESYEGAADARVESMAGGLEAYADQYELVTDDGSSDDGTASDDAERRDDAGGRTDASGAPF